MLRPIPNTSAAIVAKGKPELQLSGSPTNGPEYAEKLKLAAHLHDQGIDPNNWTKAQPADWRAQQAFAETGAKDAGHFEVAGRLYKTSPQVAATQAQGQDALDVYLGATPKPVAQLVDVANVPLAHPLGRPHDTSADRPDAHALNLHYARVAVDPHSAHKGDPLPMAQQPKLQQATRGPGGSEIPLGIPGIYRGYDDGYFYAANEGTQESAEVQALRRKLATQKAEAQGDAAAIAANDNDPEIDEEVARSYGEKKAAVPSTTAADAGQATEEVGEIESNVLQIISLIEKSQKSEALTAEESDLLARVGAAFARADVPIDLKKVDVEHLKQAVAAGADGIAMSKRAITPVEARVERLFSMSPGIERPSFIPMPVAPMEPDGTRDPAKAEWTAPSVLYDLARAFVTPGVWADGYYVSDAEIQNIATSVAGGAPLKGLGVRKAVENAGENLASRRVKLYNGPATERPFSADYPNARGRYDTAGNLTHDIDGNPLEVSGRIVGRKVVGGSDEALPAAEFDAITKAGTGRIAQTAALPGNEVGRVAINRYTRLPEEITLSKRLPSDDVVGVYGHEIGHVIDQLAGEIPTEGLTKELKALYDVGNNPNRKVGNPEMPAEWGPRFRPKDAGYKGEDVPRELMAEAIRLYMANPSYLKEVAPKTAAAIRKAVNTDLAIRKIIQFNTGGIPLPSAVPSGTGIAPDFDLSNPPQGYVYGKNFI